MRLKSYFAATVEAAMSLASRELGEEAMLVYSRESMPETQLQGKYEVVFALAEGSPPASTIPSPQVPQEQAPMPPPCPAQCSSLEALIRRMEEICTQLERGSSAGTLRPEPLRSHVREACVERLERAGLAASVVDEILDAACAEAAFKEPENLAEAEQYLSREVQSRISVDSRIGQRACGNQVVVLVGPPGAGKTTSLVKLAAHYYSNTGSIPHILAWDGLHGGDSERLRNYANILDAPFESVRSPARLERAIASRSGADLILVDSPGFGPKDLAAAEQFRRALPATEVHLVLPAIADAESLSSMAALFEGFKPARIILTRLDEARRLGPVWRHAAVLGIPLSFFSDGQAIPVDFTPASAQKLAAMVLGASIECNLAAGRAASPSPPKAGTPIPAVPEADRDPAPEAHDDLKWQPWKPPHAQPGEPVVALNLKPRAKDIPAPGPGRNPASQTAPTCNWLAGTFDLVHSGGMRLRGLSAQPKLPPAVASTVSGPE